MTERSDYTSPQAVMNMFKWCYHDLGFLGYSSHSGRRRFITNAVRKICSVGDSLRYIQILEGHSSMPVMQRYIEGDSDARKKLSILCDRFPANLVPGQFDLRT